VGFIRGCGVLPETLQNTKGMVYIYDAYASLADRDLEGVGSCFNAPAANLGTLRQTGAELSFRAGGYATILLTSIQICHLSHGISVQKAYKLSDNK